MNDRRADVIVPGPEGGWLARALEQAGLSVQRRELAQPSSGSPAVIVLSLSLEAGATPRESFERQLQKARDGAPANTPLIALLPVDAQLDDGLRGLAQGVYVRPVPVARLVHKIQALLDVAAGGAPRPSWSPSGPPVAPPTPPAASPVAPPTASPVAPPTGSPVAPPTGSPVAPPAGSPLPARPAVDDPPVRERTVRLDAVSAPSPAAAAPAGVAELPAIGAGASATPPAAVRGPSTPARRSSRPPGSEPRGAFADADPSSQVSGLIENTQPVAELSPWLHRMLSECDRRMFPAAPPLDLRFPAGDDGPLELVPRALLDVLGVPVDPAPGEGFEEHTFAADASAVPAPGTAKRHSEWPRLESSVGGTGSAPGRPATGVEELAAGNSEPPPATREVALPDAPRRNDGTDGAADREAGAHSVIARRPDEDTRRASRHARRRESAPPPPSVPPLAPISRPPASSAAGLYETAVEAIGFPPVPGGSAPPPPPRLSLGTPTADGRGRWGTLSPEAWMPFAEALRALPGEQRVSLRTDQTGVLVHVRAGQVFAPLAAPSPAVGADAAAAPVGTLSALRTARSSAREALLAELTPVGPGTGGTPSGPEVVFAVYDVSPGDELRAGSPLGTLDELMLEALRRLVSADWLRARWRDDLDRVVRVMPGGADRVAAVGVDPLWLDWLGQHTSVPFRELLVTLPEREGLPAVLVALESLDAITLADAPADAAAARSPLALRAAAREAVEEAYRASRNADYFTLLGVPPTAPRRAVERACVERSVALTNFDLLALDLDELEPLRRDVLECYAEAQRALYDDDARARYARALRGRPGI